MSASLDNVAVADGYTDAATIQNIWGARGGNLTIANASVFVQLQYGTFGTSYWTDEFAMPASTASIDPGVIGIKFRNYTAGTVARVAVYLAGPQDPVLGASQIFTGTLTPGGGTTGGGTSLISIYGDGSDGTVALTLSSTVSWATLSGSTWTLTRDVYLDGGSVTGCTVKTSGFRIFCRGTFRVNSTGVIESDGASAGAAPAAGAGGTDGTVAAPTAGGAGASGSGAGGNAPAAANMLGGRGGAGGKGFGGAGGSASGVAPLASTGLPHNLLQAITARTVAAALLRGGGGGGGGGSGNAPNNGGGGGAPGGVVVVVARNLVVVGLISANGGDGANGGAASGVTGANGGGGGGGGGCVILVYETLIHGVATETVTAGQGGTKTGIIGSSADGSPGTDGTIYLLSGT